MKYLQSLRTLMRQVKSVGLGRVVLYLFERYGLQGKLLGPRASYKLVTSLKILAHPIDYIKRRRIGDLVRLSSERISDDGYLVMSSHLPNSDILLQHLNDVFERRRDAAMEQYTHPFAAFLTYRQTDKGPLLEYHEDWEPVIEFACQPEIVSIVAQHMGEIPVLGVISFMYSAAGPEYVGSQLFHSDNNHDRMVHLVVPVRPINKDAGPFTFLPRKLSDRIKKEFHYDGKRLSDEEVFSVVDRDELIYCTGDAGQAFFVNPFQCLHQGARVKKADRLQLIISYSSRFEGADGIGAIYKSINRSHLNNGNSLRRKLLALV